MFMRCHLRKLRQGRALAEATPTASGEEVSISQAARVLATENMENDETYDFSNTSPQQLLQR